MLVTAIAPIAWGSNYYVTRHALPPDHALYGALLRALPAGLFLLAVRPRRPRGAWWWRSAVLGALNVGAFFALIYVTAQLLPTNVASMIMATSPIALMLLAWPLLGERPRVLPAVGAALGIVGVARHVRVTAPAAVSARACSPDRGHGDVVVGYILATRWGTDVDVALAHRAGSWSRVGCSSPPCRDRRRGRRRSTAPPSSVSPTSRSWPRRWRSGRGSRVSGISTPRRSASSGCSIRSPASCSARSWPPRCWAPASCSASRWSSAGS